jgi:valyl-tRNA synthetase
VSMRTEVDSAVFSGEAQTLDRLRAVEADLRAVGRISGRVDWVAGGGPLAVEVTLADQ